MALVSLDYRHLSVRSILALRLRPPAEDWISLTLGSQPSRTVSSGLDHERRELMPTEAETTDGA
jgi:hypothetical protein